MELFDAKTPDRPKYVQEPYQTFTPCTRLSRIMITNDTSDFGNPVKSFEERLIEASHRESQAKQDSEKKRTEKKRRFSLFFEEDDNREPLSSSTHIIYKHPDEKVLSLSIFDDIKYFDPGTNWLEHIYRDNGSNSIEKETFDIKEEVKEDKENESPSSLKKRKRSRSLYTEERLPLQEIKLQDDIRSKKKIINHSEDQSKICLVQTVSPPFSINKREN